MVDDDGVVLVVVVGVAVDGFGGAEIAGGY